MNLTMHNTGPLLLGTVSVPGYRGKLTPHYNMTGKHGNLAYPGRSDQHCFCSCSSLTQIEQSKFLIGYLFGDKR